MTSIKKECPDGYRSRKSYTRKFRNSITRTGFTVRRKGKLFTVRPTNKSVHVPASCIKIRNETARNNSKRMSQLRKGDLIKYGYQYRLADRLRHHALEKAIKVYGALSVYHKLDAVAKLSTKTAPDASAIFAKDRQWVRDHHKMTKQ
jgi:Family of unknown function (DUF5771)